MRNKEKEITKKCAISVICLLIVLFIYFNGYSYYYLYINNNNTWERKQINELRDRIDLLHNLFEELNGTTKNFNEELRIVLQKYMYEAHLERIQLHDDSYSILKNLYTYFTPE